MQLSSSTGTSLSPWVEVEEQSLRIRGARLLFEILRKQMAGSERWPFTVPDAPFQRQGWLVDLVRSRLLATCLPGSLLRLPPMTRYWDR